MNGRVVADEFPDWYQVLEYDRYNLAFGNYSWPQTGSYQSQPQPVGHSSSQQISSSAGGAGPHSPAGSYAQVILSKAKQQYLHFRFKILIETYRTQCSPFLHERNGSREVT